MLMVNRSLLLLTWTLLLAWPSAEMAGDDAAYVVAWGNEEQCISSPPASIVLSGAQVQQMVSGGSFTSALMDDGRVFTWGYDYLGYLDVPPIIGTPGHRAIEIAAGYDFTLALLENGEVVGWGWNRGGDVLDIPGFIGSEGKRATGIGAGSYFGMAILETGELVCWGKNVHGQCEPPADIQTKGNILSVAGGSGFAVALLQSGEVRCWGWNFYGQCEPPTGIGPTGKRATSVVVVPFQNNAFALLEDGSLVGWGNNTNNVLLIPPEIGDGSRPVSHFAVARWSALAVHPDNSVSQWGACGINDGWNGNDCLVPIEVTSATTQKLVVSAGAHHYTIVVDQYAESYCLGNLDCEPDVGGSDLAVLLSRWGSQRFGIPEDLTGDGVVGGADLAVLLSKWGPCDE